MWATRSTANHVGRLVAYFDLLGGQIAEAARCACPQQGVSQHQLKKSFPPAGRLPERFIRPGGLLLSPE